MSQEPGHKEKAQTEDRFGKGMEKNCRPDRLGKGHRAYLTAELCKAQVVRGSATFSQRHCLLEQEKYPERKEQDNPITAAGGIISFRGWGTEREEAQKELSGSPGNTRCFPGPLVNNPYLGAGCGSLVTL